MPIAPNIYALKRRLDRYFWANGTPEMELLRRILDDNFATFDRIAVIGGLVRDFAYEGRSAFRSDLDLVIDAPRGEVQHLASKLNAAPNRFGGFGCKQGHWKIDFWSLETTWARKHLPVEKLEDIITCTFFDWDAIAYNLKTKKVICADNYLERISKKTLDINLLPNPSPMGNLVRAVRRLVVWNLRAGPQLKKFIKLHLDEKALRFIQLKEAELYSYPVSTRWNNAVEAKRALLFDESRFGSQFELHLERAE